jgi:hypothetical protein
MLREGVLLAGIGIVLGTGPSIPIFGLLGAALAGVGSLRPWTLARVPLGLLLVTPAAARSRRAARGSTRPKRCGRSAVLTRFRVQGFNLW